MDYKKKMARYEDKLNTAIKKGNNFLNLISMEEFEYFPIAELYSVPYMDISFDVKI